MTPASFAVLPTRRLVRGTVVGLWFCLLLTTGFGAEPASARPGLLFREDWVESPAQFPIDQSHVAHPELRLHLHGPAQHLIKKSHHDQPADDPHYVWSGLCAEGNWAVSLERTTGTFDLSGPAKVRWRSKQSGFRELRVIVKPSGGDWLVGDLSDDASRDWRIREFNMIDMRWRKLHLDTVVEADPVIDNPDLSRIEQIGFTDLMLGGGSRACSRLDWIEVYAYPNPRH